MFEQYYQDFPGGHPDHSSFNGPHTFFNPNNNQYVNPKNAATLVSIYDPRDGEVYFILGKTDSDGQLDTFGGGVESKDKKRQGSAAYNCAQRELREETKGTIKADLHDPTRTKTINVVSHSTQIFVTDVTAQQNKWVNPLEYANKFRSRRARNDDEKEMSGLYLVKATDFIHYLENPDNLRDKNSTLLAHNSDGARNLPMRSCVKGSLSQDESLQVIKQQVAEMKSRYGTQLQNGSIPQFSPLVDSYSKHGNGDKYYDQSNFKSFNELVERGFLSASSAFFNHHSGFDSRALQLQQQELANAGILPEQTPNGMTSR